MKKNILKVAILTLVVLACFQLQAGIVPTLLKVTVLDNLGNNVEGARITLYLTADDYEKEVNAVQVLETNNKGKALFKDLEPKSYYIQVNKGDLTNIGGGEVTNLLKEGRINKVNIVIQ